VLEAEILELKADPSASAAGVVLEARKTDDRGVVSTLLVQNGTLRKGDVILTGRAYGRIRMMQDDRGTSLDEAGPATPVEITGLDEVPGVGEKFQVVKDLKRAKAITEERRKKEREAERMEKSGRLTLESLFSKIESGKLRDVKVVIKADTGGSLEVVQESLGNLSTDEVKLNVLHTAVGSVSESDVLLADVSEAIIVGFCVDVDARAERLAKDKGIEIRLYNVIYEAIDEMKAALEGLLEPERVSFTMGHLAVKEVFRISRVGAVAGCLVTDGKIERSASIRIIREGKNVYEGKIETLKRFKDDVRDVAEGYECGLKIAGHDDVKVGDVIEAFGVKEVARKLEKKA
jgi:translation initiation factor IF-2